MDSYDNETQEAWQESISSDHPIQKKEYRDEMMYIILTKCQSDECLDARLAIHHYQNKLEEKMDEVRQLETCILKLTAKMSTINCECNRAEQKACEADSGMIETSTSAENGNNIIFFDGLQYSEKLLANVKGNIELALKSDANESANQIAGGENNETAFSRLNSDEIDSGIQIDNEDEKNSGVVNFICPLAGNPPTEKGNEQIQQEGASLKVNQEFAPQIDESLQNQLIENALQENRKQMAAFRDTWSEEEREMFENGLKIHRKDFSAIAKSIPTRTVSQCVQFYYKTKKIAGYKQKFRKEWSKIRKGEKNAKHLTMPIRNPERKRRRTPVEKVGEGQKENEGRIDGQKKNGQKKKQKNEKEASKKYEVDYIFGKRPDPELEGKYEYRVFWKGYTRDDATWEPEGNLGDCREAIQNYKKRWGQ